MFIFAYVCKLTLIFFYYRNRREEEEGGGTRGKGGEGRDHRRDQGREVEAELCALRGGEHREQEQRGVDGGVEH